MKWITDEQPKKNDYYIVWENDGVSRLYFHDSKWWWDSAMYDEFDGVIKRWLDESQQDTNDVTEPQQNLKDTILKEYEKGNIVVAGFDGIQATPLKEFIKQPADGILYDLNRNEVVVLTFINDRKWINDYAVAKVIRELKSEIEKQSNQFEKARNEEFAIGFAKFIASLDKQTEHEGHLRVMLVDNEWYWESDTDGDHPLTEEELYSHYIDYINIKPHEKN